MTARLSSLLGGLLFAVACAAEEGPPIELDAGPELPPAPDVSADRDGDGVCDVTELEVETDPDDRDTDGDGLSDLAELGNQFDPRRVDSPAEDQRAVLEAVPGVSLRFAVRTTVAGDGQGLTGFFEAVPSAYDPAGSAADYYAGAQAVSADPGHNVRGFDGESQRFGTVVGETRLAFDVRFAYREPASPECASAYPFRYSVKSDLGETTSTRLYLLVVVPPDSTDARGAPEFCRPARCY